MTLPTYAYLHPPQVTAKRGHYIKLCIVISNICLRFRCLHDIFVLPLRNVVQSYWSYVREGPPVAGVSPGIFYIQGGSMSKDLSIFVDESGDPGSESKCHAIARYRFSQVADYICTLELEALKYSEGTEGRTSTLFFGTKRQFERNYLKKMRKKRLG